MGEKNKTFFVCFKSPHVLERGLKIPAHPLTATGDFTDFCHVPITHFASWIVTDCLLCEEKPFQQLNSFVSQVSGSVPDLSSGIKPQISHFTLTWHQVCLLGEVELSPQSRFYINRRNDSTTFLSGHLGDRWTCVPGPVLLNPSLQWCADCSELSSLCSVNESLV